MLEAFSRSRSRIVFAMSSRERALLEAKLWFYGGKHGETFHYGLFPFSPHLCTLKIMLEGPHHYTKSTHNSDNLKPFRGRIAESRPPNAS
jgi:hypothetical protein